MLTWHHSYILGRLFCLSVAGSFGEAHESETRDSETRDSETHSLAEERRRAAATQSCNSSPRYSDQLTQEGKSIKPEFKPGTKISSK